MNAIQTTVVNRLEAKGFRFIREIEGSEPGTTAVLLTKPWKRHTHFHAEVEADGSVNDETLDEYLSRQTPNGLRGMAE